MRRGRNLLALRARQEGYRTAAQSWRRLKPRFETDVKRSRPLALLIGGVQRGVVESWLVRTTPATRTFRKVLTALSIDPTPYAEFLRERGGAVECVCPVCRRPWSSQRYLLNRAERRRRRRRLPRMRRRPDGTVEWTCARCIRRQIGRDNFRDLNQPGRIRGRDKQARRRGPKTPAWKDGIARAHVLKGDLSKPFHLCPLCGLSLYARDWHQVCWLSWKWHCYRLELDATDVRPSQIKRRGPDPARRLKRNYELLVERSFRTLDRNGDRRRPSREEILSDPQILAEKPAVGSWVKPTGRRGRRRTLRSASSVNKAIGAFLRLAPGGWNQIFTKSESGNAARQQALPLPAALEPLIISGERDTLIRRLHEFRMRHERIASLTGASLDRVTRVIAGETNSEPEAVRHANGARVSRDHDLGPAK